MATYYVDPAHGGSNSGTQDNPWTDIQTAFDTATAGDTVYCRGTQTISAAIDIDTNSGTGTSRISFVGTNSSWVNDGTYFTIDGQDNDIDGLYFNGPDYIVLENIRVTQCGTSLGRRALTSAATTSLGCSFLNCSFDNSREGVYGSYFTYSVWERCTFADNASNGLYRPASSASFRGCLFTGNGARGCDNNTSADFAYCVFANNTSEGVYVAALTPFMGCVFDNNTLDGVVISSTSTALALFTGCRFTNHTTSGEYGIRSFNTTVVPRLKYCYFGNNTAAIQGDYEIISVNGSTSHVILNGSDTNHGYVDRANGDWRLRSDASLVQQAVAMDDVNAYTLTAGLPIVAPTLPTVGQVQSGVEFGYYDELTGTYTGGGGGGLLRGNKQGYKQ